ncbi:MAG: efflux RND transporter periplasmic adaptor subunit [bacterium]
MGKGKPKSKKKLFIFGGLGLLLLIVILVVAFGGSKEVIVSVTTEKAETRIITQIVSATGKINPVNKVELRPEVNGEIVELPVEEGDMVKKGQLLIRMKPEQYIAQRDRAKAYLEASKASLKIRQASKDQIASEYKRVSGLFEKGLASGSEIEIAKSSFLQAEGAYEAQKADVQQAEASLNEAQEQLAKTAIYSPLNGTISTLDVELNERVLGSSFSQGTLLMTVSDLRDMEATVEVDENDIVLVSVGDTTSVEIDAFGDRKFKGIVTQVGNSAITSGLGTQNEVVNFEIKILLLENDPGIKPGMSCDADIETETRSNVISVPIQSVTARSTKPTEKIESEDGNGEIVATKTNGKGKVEKPKEIVFVVENNKAKKMEVETGISDDNYIEIKSGLKGSEEIINGPYRAISKDLEEGTTVMVQGREKGKSASKTQEQK